MVVFTILRQIASWRVLLAALLVALPLWAVTATPAYACSCMSSTLEEQVAQADLIVVGTTVHVRDDAISSISQTATFVVAGYVKGSGPPILEHQTGVQSEACQYLTEIGGRYLLLLRSRDDGPYLTSTCSGNLDVTSEDGETASAYIDEIGLILHPGVDVADLPAPAPPLDPGSRDFLPGVILSTAAFAALLAAGALIFRRSG